MNEGYVSTMIKGEAKEVQTGASSEAVEGRCGGRTERTPFLISDEGGMDGTCLSLSDEEGCPRSFPHS